MSDAAGWLRALNEAAYEAPWRTKNIDGELCIVGKTGPGWYDAIADPFGQDESTAALVVALCNARDEIAALIEAAERVLYIYEADVADSGALIRLNKALAAVEAKLA